MWGELHRMSKLGYFVPQSKYHGNPTPSIMNKTRSIQYSEQHIVISIRWAPHTCAVWNKILCRFHAWNFSLERVQTDRNNVFRRGTGYKEKYGCVASTLLGCFNQLLGWSHIRHDPLIWHGAFCRNFTIPTSAHGRSTNYNSGRGFGRRRDLPQCAEIKRHKAARPGFYAAAVELVPEAFFCWPKNIIMEICMETTLFSTEKNNRNQK